MSLGPPTLDALAREHPEWRPWLAPLAQALRALEDPTWAAAVPDEPAAGGDGVPLLDGARLEVDSRAARRHVSAVLGAAAEGGDARFERAARARDLDPLALLAAAANGAPVHVAMQARALGLDETALAALAPLLAAPLLHAAAARWRARVPAGWRHGYCPICGAWPVLAEARGLERDRRLRCGRCGGDWWADWVRCPFCDNRDHTRLGALVPGADGDTRRVETCAACGGYLKTVTTLGATRPADLPLLDLATVDLDVAALERGAVRRDGLGHPVAVAVAARPGRSRLFAWVR